MPTTKQETSPRQQKERTHGRPHHSPNAFCARGQDSAQQLFRWFGWELLWAPCIRFCLWNTHEQALCCDGWTSSKVTTERHSQTKAVEKSERLWRTPRWAPTVMRTGGPAKEKA